MTAWRLIFTDGRLLFSFFICLVSMGGFMAWASIAPLAEGVTAQGTVVVENDRKIVQHLEGGIIEHIHIQEGDLVQADEPLMVLTDIATSAGRDQITYNLVNYLAAIDRLTALSDGAAKVEFSERTLSTAIANTAQKEILDRQNDLFAQQTRRREAEIRVLSSRASGLQERAENQQAQIDSHNRSVEIIEIELDRKQSLLEENLISADTIVALERDLSLAVGELSRLKTDQEQNLIDARNVVNQIAQIEAEFDEAASQELLEARSAVSEATEQLRTAQDVLSRTTLYAPIAGEILNLKFTTLGGIVQPGEAVAEIVPRETQLVALLEIPPNERDRVYEGLIVQTRLSGYDSWAAPHLEGSIMDVTPDLKTSPNGEYSYYEARVMLDTQTLEQNGLIASPGMPVEAFVSSGQKRTLLSYLVEPIQATFRRGFKE
ncbi:MAG: HlyD family type I secretion periplasmic adaptor subunit [Pseudomonadota bacterium]